MPKYDATSIVKTFDLELPNPHDIPTERRIKLFKQEAVNEFAGHYKEWLAEHIEYKIYDERLVSFAVHFMTGQAIADMRRDARSDGLKEYFDLVERFKKQANMKYEN
jgi:hypothetical protein